MSMIGYSAGRGASLSNATAMAKTGSAAVPYHGSGGTYLISLVM
jgi:hypothetical protein